MASSSSPRRVSLSHIDKEQLKQKLDTSHFDFNAIFRGIQLTLVGGTSTAKFEVGFLILTPLCSSQGNAKPSHIHKQAV
jgi:hypothetical protein